MLKQIVTLESIVEGKVGQFLLAHDTDVKIARKMCLQFMNYLDQIEEAAAKNQQPPVEKPPEEPKEEVNNG
jgi:hypothetical protein